jgi:16S rRNA (guanine966-N2)-methyltransferase
MRVVAGSARGRRLVAPPGRLVRPTTDRTREAVFNALESLDAVAEATVLDLFAGTGALGIEALSRGAARVVFVERDRAARRCLEANLATTDLRQVSHIITGDAGAFVGRAQERFDLVLLDPPYGYDGWSDLLGGLEAIVTDRALVVIESDRAPEMPADWLVERRKRYGGTFVVIARPPSRRSEPSEKP